MSHSVPAENSSPLVFHLGEGHEHRTLQDLVNEYPTAIVHDSIEAQIIELVKVRNVGHTLSSVDMKDAIHSFWNGRPLEECGAWIYYPWSSRLVHLLSEDDFITVRTDRNKLKLTEEEQRLLSSKKIGLVGLSVGHAAAMTLALERGFGELRIADFDVLDLSNLNRIRSTVHNIGIPKTSITARDIAELDPYLKVVTYEQGITEDNLDDFLDGLDLVIDECDSIDMKLALRECARSKGIPVIMETSDRGMLDVERFDEDDSLPILHGLTLGMDYDRSKDLTNEQKIPFVQSIIGFDQLSPRLKESMGQIGRTISTWPQLGADVTLGGATVAHTSRKLLLGHSVQHGRYYIDLSDLIENEEARALISTSSENHIT